MQTSQPTENTGLPRNLLLQWHITERCNLRCLHCYQEGGDTAELSFEELQKIFYQFMAFRRKALSRHRWHITVTGGEPFVRHDFFRLLELFAAHKDSLTFAILTNGTFIGPAEAKALRKLNPSFVQVSIEGSIETHEKVRGSGNYKKAVDGLKQLRKQGLKTYISFTAHADNFREFPEVAKLARALRVDMLWADRLIPIGTGGGLQTLSPRETKEFFEIMHQEKKRKRFWQRTKIGMHRALQFLLSGGTPYRCYAGRTLLALHPNGDIVPCRRMPVVVGNVLEQPFEDIYRESAFLKELRGWTHAANGCEGCSHARSCGGGLRCLAAAQTGSPFFKDPGCWLAADKT